MLGGDVVHVAAHQGVHGGPQRHVHGAPHFEVHGGPSLVAHVGHHGEEQGWRGGSPRGRILVPASSTPNTIKILLFFYISFKL